MPKSVKGGGPPVHATGISKPAKPPKGTKKGKKIIKNLEEAVDLTTPAVQFEQVGQVGQGMGNDMIQMPARYFKRDSRDSFYDLKSKMATDARPAPLTDGEVRNIMDKESQYQEAAFDNWFLNAYPINSANPVMQKWAQSANPETFDRREKYIDEMAELQARLAKLRLRGAHNKEDLMLAYQLDTGALDVERVNKPLWNLGGEPLVDNFKRGAWNPLRLKSWKATANIGLRDSVVSRNLDNDGAAQPSWASSLTRGNNPTAEFRSELGNAPYKNNFLS